MLKVFLSHSSLDKPFVQQVAHGLHRAHLVFDEQTFSPGQDFRDAIIKGLDSSRFFVFFASRRSLDSSWCKYELDEAQLRLIETKLDAQLVVIIEPSITVNDLPPWLRKCKVIVQTRPTQVLREVQHILFAIAPSESKNPFIGRHNELRDFNRALANLEAPPRCFVVSGLEGIGRRSLVGRVCSDMLGLRLGPIYLWDETRDFSDLYLWAYGETSDFGERAELASEIQRFRGLTEARKLDEIAGRLQLLCRDRCVPCFVDQGGMLDDAGRYKQEIATLIGRLGSASPDCFLVCVHRRHPSIENVQAAAKGVFRLRVPPLEQPDMKLLFQQLLRREGLSTSPAVIEEIADYLDGYPPSAYFCAQFSKQYGVANLQADKSVLVDFKARRFSRFVSQLNLTEKQWEMLRYLASEQAIPVAAIAAACNHPLDATASDLRQLIDLSLAIVVNENIAIAAPLRDSIHRLKGFLDTKHYEKVRERLTATFWSSTATPPSVEVVDATLNAVARSGIRDFDPYQDLVQVSTVHRLAQESYYRKDWTAALEYAKRARRMDPGRADLRVIIFKALVQLEEWGEANKILTEIEKHGDKHHFYLKGFMLRKRRKYGEAITAFRSAIDAGDRSVPVYRDCGDCLFRAGKIEEAAEMIRRALVRDSENIYVLDLLVRVFTELGDHKNAQDYLQQLARFDIERRFVHHRQSVLYASKGMWDLALAEADTACETGYAPFEAFAQRIDVLIESKQFEKAEREIEGLEQRFKGQRRDIQIGLRCKLMIRQGRWREGRTLWEQLKEKSAPVHQALLYRILELQALDTSISLTEREAVTKQLKELKGKVRHVRSISAIEPESIE